MSDKSDYTPPKVWVWNKPNGGHFANINRPIAGPTHDKKLPVGRHPLQLYSLGTPNGVKVTIMLEELLAFGHHGAEYDAWLIKIGEGDQFGSGFVEINPNSKIPALLDRSGPIPIRVFESGSILCYLAEKFSAFLPTDVARRAECLSWHLRLCSGEDRICHRPLCYGSEAPARRTRSPVGGVRFHRGR
jgi:GST-like protein